MGALFLCLSASTSQTNQGGFRDYAAAEPRWAAAVALLDEDGGLGWDFLQGMIFAREAAARQIKRTRGDISSVSMQTAKSQKDHPFLKGRR